MEEGIKGGRERWREEENIILKNQKSRTLWRGREDE